MKNEIIYRNRKIIEGTNGLFTAYYSNHSSNLTKEFKTLEQAKKQIDKWLDNQSKGIKFPYLKEV